MSDGCDPRVQLYLVTYKQASPQMGTRGISRRREVPAPEIASSDVRAKYNRLNSGSDGT